MSTMRLIAVRECDWELFQETLRLDSMSKAFDQDLRQRIATGLENIEDVTEIAEKLIDDYNLSGAARQSVNELARALSGKDTADTEVVSASDIKEGDYLDLAGDLIADPGRDNPLFETEFVLVGAVQQETPDCIVLFIEGVDAFGFPTGHPIRRRQSGPCEQ